MARHLPHLGLRTVKTGLAVALALFFADLRGSPLPIFAAIGAIVAMSRTVGDAFETCRTQFFGILLGAGFGALFVNLFAGFRWLGVGLGLIALILLCNQLKLQLAKLEDVKNVMEIPQEQLFIREVVLVKCEPRSTQIPGFLHAVEDFGGRCQIIEGDVYVVELTDTPDSINFFIEELREYRIQEISRTGGVALQLSKETVY